MTKAKTVPEHPQADDLQERWLQLAFKVKRSEFSRRASAMVRAAKQFHGCAGECQRPSGLAVVCLGAASCSERHATRVVAWEPGCSGRLLAIFWHKNPPEITRFPWSRPAALVVACGRTSCAGSLGTQLARSCAGASTGTACKRTTLIAAPVHALTLHSLLRRCIHWHCIQPRACECGARACATGAVRRVRGG